ncbi:MAG: amidohydrolase [Chitinophagaceae bacterium]
MTTPQHNACRNSFPIVILLILLPGIQSVQVPSPDIILTNGKIFTADSSQLYAQALAIKGNKILAVGSNAVISKLASSKTKKIDLMGKTVVPGFNDAHDHIGWFFPVGLGFVYTEMNTEGLSKAALLDSVSKLAKMAKPNQWIHGLIGTATFFDSSMRSALDSIAPNNPVVLQVWWGNGQVVNQKALEASGLSDNDKDPVAGWYNRVDGSNNIFAIQQNAQVPIWNSWFSSEPENLIKGLRSFAQEQVLAGITTVQLMSSILNGSQSAYFFKEAQLPQRIRIIAWPQTTSHGRQLAEWNLKNTHPTPLTYISGIKYLIDGTPLERNALNKKPYNKGGNWYGRLNYPIDTMKQILKEALTSNRQLMMHITGDSSFAVVLSLMKQMAGGDVWKSKRVRIEHNATPHITASEVNDVRELGLLMMHTPKYCQSSPLRSFIEKGITVGISPDGTTNPFRDIMVVTSQQTNPAENISREQAIIAYTKTNAYAEFAEKEKGTLGKGMLADLAVLSQDIFTVPTRQLPSTTSVLTIVDGKIVYQQPKIPGLSR